MVSQIASSVDHTSQYAPHNWPGDGSALLPSWNDIPATGGIEPTPITDPLPAVHDQGTLHDAAVQQRLGQLQPGLSAIEVESWVYDYLGFLANIDKLSKPKLLCYVEWLVQRLKAFGYASKTPKQYQGVWKKIANAKVEQKKLEKKAEAAEQKAGGHVPGRFSIRTRTLPEANDPKYLDPATGERLPDAPPLSTFQTEGIFDNESCDFLTNFTLLLDREVEVRDEFEPRKVFEGTLTIFGKKVPFKINAEDYADNKTLTAAITVAAGSGAVIHCNPAKLREAISILSWRPGVHQVSSRVVTTDFGWTQDGMAFLVPSGTITAQGFTPVDDQTELHVDLQGEEVARQLDLKAAKDPVELKRIKKHVVEDLLKLHDRQVTYPLLGSVGAAVMGHFAPRAAPFALWLVGLTGAGKSYAAKLFMNFFGNFSEGSAKFGSWGSTPYYLQKQGFFFKDSLYLIDDFKPEVNGKHGGILGLLQNYSDRQGRGRLRADASTNTTRPIRGLLISTGEDVPEHSASSIARSIIIHVRQKPKDTDRGCRCEDQCQHYQGVTADFVREVLAQCRGPVFAKMVRALRKYYCRDIAGEQNDSRIAGNFALLGAGFVEMARYLKDVWPEWKAAIRQFLTVDLIAIRDEMVGATKEQQASEVFWSILRTLMDHRLVEIDGDSQADKAKAVIGRPFYRKPDPAIAGRADLVCISTDLALAEVNKLLRAQSRPELKVSPAALLNQLRQDGKLFDDDGQPMSLGDDGGETTKQVYIGQKRRRAFITSKALFRSPETDKLTVWSARKSVALSS